MSVVIQSLFSDLDLLILQSPFTALPRLSPGRSSSDLLPQGHKVTAEQGKKPTGGDTATGETERETEREIERKRKSNERSLTARQSLDTKWPE